MELNREQIEASAAIDAARADIVVHQRPSTTDLNSAGRKSSRRIH